MFHYPEELPLDLNMLDKSDERELRGETGVRMGEKDRYKFSDYDKDGALLSDYQRRQLVLEAKRQPVRSGG